MNDGADSGSRLWGPRNKNDRNVAVNDCDLQLDLELTERVGVNDATLIYAEEY